MDKEKEIEKMAADLDKAKELALGTVGSLNNGFGGWYAKCLVEKGYGDVRAAVKEFAEKLKEKFIGYVAAYVGEEDNGRYGEFIAYVGLDKEEAEARLAELKGGKK